MEEYLKLLGIELLPYQKTLLGKSLKKSYIIMRPGIGKADLRMLMILYKLLIQNEINVLI